MSTGRVLVVDDDPEMCDMVLKGLSAWGYEALQCASAEEALALMDRAEPDVVVTDLKMRGMDGTELCHRLVDRRPDLPVIVLTGFGSMESAIEALRAGAFDFLVKPVELAALALAVGRARDHRALREEVRRLRDVVGGARPHGIVGESEAMRSLFDLLGRLEATEATVLLQGETGTGKEMVARELHRSSRRAQGPFVAVNCGAIPATLLEAEFFGHSKGAFTGAVADRDGIFVRAHTGTLFLDEIADLPMDLQSKLLRALQERRVAPVGGSEERSFDVRLLVATHRDLAEQVRLGHFREDLYYRLAVIVVPIPPLQDREGDVMLLAQEFLERFARQSGKPVRGFTPGVVRRLIAHTWPGNVRELQNCIERAVALTAHEDLVVDDLPESLANSPRRVPAGVLPEGILPPLADVERAYIDRVMEATRGNRAEAARILGLDRKTLYNRMRRYSSRPVPEEA